MKRLSTTRKPWWRAPVFESAFNPLIRFVRLRKLSACALFALAGCLLALKAPCEIYTSALLSLIALVFSAFLYKSKKRTAVFFLLLSVMFLFAAYTSYRDQRPAFSVNKKGNVTGVISSKPNYQPDKNRTTLYLDDVTIDVGQFNGVLYNLDLAEGSVNCIRSTIQQFPFLPIPDYNYGYFYAGKNHFTDRQMKSNNLYQIFITHSGKGRLYVEGNEFELDKNTIVLLDLNSRHRYETASDHWEYEWVNFSGSPCAYYYSKINQSGVKVYDMMSNSRLNALLHDVGVLAAETSEMKYIMTGNAIMRLLDEFMAFSMEYAQQKMLPHKKDNIEKIKRYMDEHYMDEISLDQLSEMAYLSKYHFTRTFTAYTGTSPYQYLTALRLNHARHLLLLTNISIEEISFQTGFKNSKNFIRAFKQAIGTTPEKYRQSQR